MNPVRGIETSVWVFYGNIQNTFKLMNPVRGIETLIRDYLNALKHDFQINESRSRDWNAYEKSQARA